MRPKTRLLQLTLYSSKHCLIKPELHADSNPWEGSWHVSRICWNFVKDSSLIASAGSCCPHVPLLLPFRPFAFHSKSWCFMGVHEEPQSLLLASMNILKIPAVNKDRHKSPQQKSRLQSTLINEMLVDEKEDLSVNVKWIFIPLPWRYH